jgi:hypothetical protein
MKQDDSLETISLLADRNQAAVKSPVLPKSISTSNCIHLNNNISSNSNISAVNSPSLSVATTVIGRTSETTLALPKRTFANSNSNVSNCTNNNNNSNNKTAMESNLAAIMMGYVLVFLICHLPRLLLNIHELATIRFEKIKISEMLFNNCVK